MRHIIDQDDIKKILSFYNNGKSMTYIAIILDISHYAVKSIIKNNTGYYTETKFIKPHIVRNVEKRKRIRQNNKNIVIDQYLNGASISEILETNKNKFFSVDDILRILTEAKINLSKDKEAQDILHERKRAQKNKEQDSFTNKLAIFKNNVKIGDRFLYQYINRLHEKQEKEITVMAKYDKFVKTELECVSYFDLYYSKKLN